MGQRLVVTIKDKGEPKMKVYYHWSGYTLNAFDELKTLWGIIKPLKERGLSTEEILLGIIHGLEGNVDEEHKKWLEEHYPDYARSCHGGIDGGKDSDEWKYITSLYPNEIFSEDVDRNNGLVAMSDKGMDEMQNLSEGDAEINIDTETFINYVHWPYDDKEDYVYNCSYHHTGDKPNDEVRKEYEQEYDSIPTYNGNGVELFEGKCDDIDTCLNTVFNLVGNSGHEFKDERGTVWELTA